jgi:hypothetical protein
MKPWNIKRVIPEVNTKFGAPMGRRSYGVDPNTVVTNEKEVKVYDKRVPMCSCCGAYDAGGSYWGCGPQLRVRFTADLEYVEFYREGDVL